MNNTSIPDTAPTFPQTLQSNWIAAAQAKGFDLVCRVQDRYHLLLRCQACGAEHASRINVVRDHQPLCPHCIEARWRADAEAAGLTWLGRDPESRHHGLYQAECGHEARRQFEFVKRVAAGTTDLRCETCHQAAEKAEAEARGWELIGVDPEGDPNYRLYRHQACAHQQRIARANMQSGRFTCSVCGEGWAAAPSFLYAMQFKLPAGAKLVKLGFSRDPKSRLHYQLKRRPDLEAQILRTVAMQSGHSALCTEKRLHAQLKAQHPDLIIPPERYQDWLRVRSEIYCAQLTANVLALLDEVEASPDAKT